LIVGGALAITVSNCALTEDVKKIGNGTRRMHKDISEILLLIYLHVIYYLVRVRNLFS
jgi:hypothetical protein